MVDKALKHSIIQQADGKYIWIESHRYTKQILARSGDQYETQNQCIVSLANHLKDRPKKPSA